jgi:uncharacterized membrane protein HdeD (DUF308 family)
LALAVGIIAIAWPNVTIGAVVIIFAIATFVNGARQAAHAFSSGRVGPVVGVARGEGAGQRALLGLRGLLSASLGIVLFARLDVGAVSLAAVGMYLVVPSSTRVLAGHFSCSAAPESAFNNVSEDWDEALVAHPSSNGGRQAHCRRCR